MPDTRALPPYHGERHFRQAHGGAGGNPYQENRRSNQQRIKNQANMSDMSDFRCFTAKIFHLRL